ncbi:MAG: DUF3461 family protein [Sodalis sp. (in: enterobacteria)]
MTYYRLILSTGSVASGHSAIIPALFNNLKILGVNYSDTIDLDRYGFRLKGDSDIIKIYFCQDQSEFLPKKVKF